MNVNEIHGDAEFQLACARGDLARARRLVADMRLNSLDARMYNNVALRAACSHGHLKVARWLASRFVLAADNSEPVRTAFYLACEAGHTAVAEWLADRFRLDASVAYMAQANAFWSACERGHLETAKWLVARFSLTIEELRNVYHNGLLQVCQNGHADVLQWVIAEFGFKVQGEMLRCACVCGHLELARWVAARLPPGQHHLMWRDVLCAACAAGQLEVARWLATCVDDPAPVCTTQVNIHWMTFQKISRAQIIWWLIKEFNALEAAPIDCLMAMFDHACQHGDLDLAQHLAGGQRIGITEIRRYGRAAIQDACGYGHMHVLRWLCDRYPIDGRDIYPYCEYGLTQAGHNGHLEVLQWVTEKFGPGAQAPWNWYNQAMHLACAEGHLEVVQWLVWRFELKLVDARVQNSNVAWIACENGHLAVAKWLATNLRIPFTEMGRLRIGSLFQRRCISGDLGAVQWLVEQYDIKAADIRATQKRILCQVCKYGRLEVMKWLVARFGLTAMDISMWKNSALSAACEYGHLAMAKWLVARFGLGQEGRSVCWATMMGAAVQGRDDRCHMPVVRWIMFTYMPPLTARTRSLAQGADAELVAWLAARLGTTRRALC